MTWLFDRGDNVFVPYYVSGKYKTESWKHSEVRQGSGDLIPQIPQCFASPVPCGNLIVYCDVHDIGDPSSPNVHDKNDKASKHRQESGGSTVPGSNPGQSNHSFHKADSSHTGCVASRYIEGIVTINEYIFSVVV